MSALLTSHDWHRVQPWDTDRAAETSKLRGARQQPM